MTRRYPLLAAALLAVAAAPHAQTVTLDASYTPTQSASIGYARVLSAGLDGKDRELLLSTANLNQTTLRLERLDVLGGLDPSFQTLDLTAAFPSGSFGLTGAVRGFEGDSIAVAGSSSTGSPSGPMDSRAYVGRFGEDGAPAPGYGPLGIVPLPLPFQANIAAVRIKGARTYLAVQNIQTKQCAIAALTSGGRLDASFGTNGVVTLPTTPACIPADLLVLGERLYLLGGLSGRTVPSPTSGVLFARTLDGAAVPTFGTAGRADIGLSGEALIPTTLAEWNGKIAMGGYTAATAQQVVVGVLTTAGQPDASFGNRAGLDVRETPYALYGPRVGLASVSGALVAVVAGKGVPRQEVRLGQTVEIARYGLLSTIYGFGGDRVDQASGPNGFGFVLETEGEPGTTQKVYRGVWADVASQGRIVAAGWRVQSGSGIQVTRVVGLRLDGFGTAADDAPAVAGALRVSPNPTAAAARVVLTLAEASAARVTVLDALGRTVAVLADGALPAGETALRLDAARLPAGVYAVVATVGGERRVTRVTVVR